MSEFLNDEEVHGRLLKLAGSDFCPLEVLVHSMLAVHKHFDLDQTEISGIIVGISHAQALAEDFGRPPFTNEMGYLIHMCRRLAVAN